MVLPEVVRDTELVTEFVSSYTVHLLSDTPTVLRREVWRREKCIGTGGFGDVFLETCVQGQAPGAVKQRAVKIIRLGNHSTIVDYSRELEALAKFSQKKFSRCFVKSYGWYQDDASLYISLEYLPLGDLGAYMFKRQQIPELEAQQICSQLLDGLKFMHEAGFAHRDLKPANVLIRSSIPSSWWVKLSDLGLSKRTQSTGDSTGLRGTIGFIAPERYGFVGDNMGNQDLWLPGDIWSLGEISFRLITGQAAFQDLGLLSNYARGESDFPTEALGIFKASPKMIDFVKSTMLAEPAQRPNAVDALSHPWVSESKPAHSMGDIRLSAISRTIGGTSISSPSQYRDWSTLSNIRRNELPSEQFPEVASPSNQEQNFLDPSSLQVDHETPVSGTQYDTSIDAERPQHRPAPHAVSLPAPRSLQSMLPLQTTTVEPNLFEAITSPEITELIHTTSRTKDFRITSLKQHRSGHNGIKRVSYSPDSKFVVATSGETAQLWSIETNRLLRSRKDHTGPICCIIFSPDSKWVASASADGSIYVWEISTGDEVAILQGHTGKVTWISFSPDCHQIASASFDRTVRVWDLVKGKQSKIFRVHKHPVVWVGFCGHKRKLLLSASQDGYFHAWKYDPDRFVFNRWSSAAIIYQLHSREEISVVSTSPTSSHLAVASLNNTIRLWEFVDSYHTGFKYGRLLKGHERPVSSIAFSSNDLLASVSLESIRFWKAQTGLPILNIRGFDGPVYSVDFSQGSQWRAVTSSDRTLDLWDTHRVKHLSDIQTHIDGAVFLAFSPDHRFIASVSRDPGEPEPIGSTKMAQKQEKSTTVMVWDVQNETPSVFIHAHDDIILSLCFSEDSTKVGSISASHIVRMWDIASGSCLKSIDTVECIASQDIYDTGEPFPCAAFSPGLRRYASVLRHARKEGKLIEFGFCICLYDMETECGHQILENNAIFDDILALAFSSDGNKIAAINQNEVITIWDVFTCQVLARFIDPARISLQRSGLILFSGANAIGVNTIGRNSYRSRIRYAGYPKLVFSPNHRQIALFSGNTAIRLWDFRSGFLLWKGGDTDFGLRADTNPGPKLQAHTLPAISPDWSRCVTVMKDVLYLRDVSTGTLMRQLKRHTEDVFQVIFSPNSSLLASASGNDIVIWDAKNGDLLRMLGAGLERPISSIVFWPDSRRLMSISSNRVLQLWDAQTGMMVTAFEGHTGRRTVT